MHDQTLLPSEPRPREIDAGAASSLTAAEELLDLDPKRAIELATSMLDAENRLVAARAAFVVGRGHHAAGGLEAAAELLMRARDDFLEVRALPDAARVMLALGRVQRDLGQFELAGEQFHAALALAELQNDNDLKSDALNSSASVLSAQGEYTRALGFLERAMALRQGLGVDEKQANLLNNMGELHLLLGNYPDALQRLKAAYDIYRSVTPAVRSSRVNLVSLGRLYHDMGNLEEARAFFQQAKESARTARDVLVEAVALNNLANIELNRQEWQAALALFEQALRIARTAGARQLEIDNLDGLGQVRVALGDFERAAEIHHDSLAVAVDIGDHEGELDALMNLGRDYLAVAQPERATSFLVRALPLAERQRLRGAQVHELLADAYEASGEQSKALFHYRAFHQAEKVVFNQENEERTRRLTVQFEVERARHEAEVYRLRTEIMQQARDEAEAEVRERTRELEEAQLEIATRLALAGEFRDDDTGEHTRRVGRNAAAIAYALGWPEDDVQLLFTAARLHDVGKIGVSDAILHKPGRLDPQEAALMRTHTTIGARILTGGSSRVLKVAEEIALAHHERWDGRGYPLGLKAEEIPMSARIVAAADVLDALTHQRPYKRAWSVEAALQEIERESGQHFDPQVAAACRRVFDPGSTLSPTDSASDWQTTARQLKSLFQGEPSDAQQQDLSEAVREHYERLLREKTYELEAAQREARAVSQNLRELAFSDPLTGLGNRRAFEADLEAEVARALQGGVPLTLLALDVDDLKAVNDGEGHERGDELLRVVAAALGRHLQGCGKVYRVGGDEFMGILCGIGSGDHRVIQELVIGALESVRNSAFPGAGVSTGLATLPDEVRTAGELIRLSDQRMYGSRARRRGAEPPESL